MTGRTLTTGLKTGLAAPHVTLVVLVELGLVSGTEYLCDAPHDVDWDGHTWKAAYGIGSIEPVTETDEQAQGLQFTLAAVNPAQVALALTELAQAHNRPVKLRLLLIKEDGSKHEDPNVWSGYLDRPVLEDGPKPLIRVTAEHEGIAWQQPSQRRFSQEDQQAAHPGDMFFEFAASMENKALVWPNRRFFAR